VHAEPRHFAQRFDEEFELLERRLYAILLPGCRPSATCSAAARSTASRSSSAAYARSSRRSSTSLRQRLERRAAFTSRVYLASATQEGSAIDRVLATLSAASTWSARCSRDGRHRQELLPAPPAAAR